MVGVVVTLIEEGVVVISKNTSGARLGFKMKMVTGIATVLFGTSLLGFAGPAASAARVGATSASAPGPALPSRVPLVTSYTMNCSALGGLIHFPTSVSTSTRAPGATLAGHSVDLVGFQTTVSVPADFVNLLLEVGLTSLSGQVTTLDVNATNTINGTVNIAAMPLDFTVPLTRNQPASFTIPNTPARIGPWTAGSSGTIVFSPGQMDLKASVAITCSAPSPTPTLGMTAIR